MRKKDCLQAGEVVARDLLNGGTGSGLCLGSEQVMVGRGSVCWALRNESQQVLIRYRLPRSPRASTVAVDSQSDLDGRLNPTATAVTIFATPSASIPLICRSYHRGSAMT